MSPPLGGVEPAHGLGTHEVAVLTVPVFTQEQWIKYAKAIESRPPMPWWAMRDTTDADLGAMYQYIRHLGPAGEPAPDFVAPDKEPKPPYESRQLVK